MAKYSAIVCVALILSVMLIAPRAQGLTCDTVTSSLKPCGSALQKGGTVTSSCCSGIKSLSAAASTAAARKTACQCVKSIAKSYKVSSQVISTVAKKCKVNIPSISSIDCNKVN